MLPGQRSTLSEPMPNWPELDPWLSWPERAERSRPYGTCHSLAILPGLERGLGLRRQGLA